MIVAHGPVVRARRVQGKKTYDDATRASTHRHFTRMTTRLPALLSTRLRAEVFAHLAAMEQAGLPAQKAWGLLKLPAPWQPRVDAVKKAVGRGSNPAIAAQSAGLFSTLEAKLVIAALTAGSPARAYRRLAERCALRAHTQSQLRSRFALPVAVWVVACVIAPVPPWVAGTLSTAGYLWQVAKPLVSLLLIAGAAMFLLAQPRSDAWLLKLPTLGPALARGQAQDFFDSLGLLLEAGVPMFEALPMAVSTISNRAMRQAYAAVLPRMQQGATLSQALEDAVTAPHFLGNARVLEMISTGEASGTLPDMLSRHCQAESQDLALFWSDVAQWLPRIAYAAVALWIAYGLLTGPGVTPQLPAGI